MRCSSSRRMNANCFGLSAVGGMDVLY
jgi:hypothetical protein